MYSRGVTLIAEHSVASAFTACYWVRAAIASKFKPMFNQLSFR